MIVVSHPTGNANVAALLKALLAADRSFFFETTIGLARDASLPRVLPGGFRGEIERRRYPVPAACLGTRPWREGARLISKRLGIRGLFRSEDAWASVYSVYRDLDAHCGRRIATRAAEAVYCYEDGALATFEAARESGARRIYDLPIAYWELRNRLMDEEIERLPAWAGTIPGASDSAAKLARKTAEFELAEAVVCPSQFVLDSLPESARTTKRCLVSEFGSPSIPREGPTRKPAPNERLRVLFAGSMTQRKGLADVFAALKMLNRSDVELVVLGSPVAPMEFYRRELADFTYEPPRPHTAVLELMRSCDLLVLPSLVEGRALVQQEAMMCGLPILVTPNAGAADLIEEGRTGFLLPIRSPDKIAEKIGWCADHRSALPEMREHARRKAETYTWEAYGNRVVGLIDSVLSE